MNCHQKTLVMLPFQCPFRKCDAENYYAMRSMLHHLGNTPIVNGSCTLAPVCCKIHAALCVLTISTTFSLMCLNTYSLVAKLLQVSFLSLFPLINPPFLSLPIPCCSGAGSLFALQATHDGEVMPSKIPRTTKCPCCQSIYELNNLTESPETTQPFHELT